MQSITCALTRTPTSDPVHLGFPDDSSNPDETTVFDRARHQEVRKVTW